jgi:chemotaxis protein MotA
MDIATIIGYLSGAFFVIVIVIGIDGVGTFVDVPSMAIVVGGGVAATLISVPLEQVLNMPKSGRFVFFYQGDSPVALIKRMVEFAEIARRDGILALENVTDTIQDPFLVKGIQLAVDGTDPELIEQIMNTELENLEARHMDGKKPFDLLNKYSPAWGMIGTLIGLINMLKLGMDDPQKLTQGMAVALITTMYGSILANYVVGPIGDKLAIRSSQEMLLKSIVLRGVMSIQSGDNPRIVEQKLMIFLPPSMRTTEDEE